MQVRTLTLSILRNMLEIEDVKGSKHLEMCDKFIQIEDMSILNPKFSSLVKSSLTEAKVLMESENSTDEIRQVCIWKRLIHTRLNFEVNFRVYIL